MYIPRGILWGYHSQQFDCIQYIVYVQLGLNIPFSLWYKTLINIFLKHLHKLKFHLLFVYFQVSEVWRGGLEEAGVGAPERGGSVFRWSEEKFWSRTRLAPRARVFQVLRTRSVVVTDRFIWLFIFKFSLSCLNLDLWLPDVVNKRLESASISNFKFLLIQAVFHDLKWCN